MAKDAKGHGSDARGVAGNVNQAYKNAAKLGPDHPSVGKSLQAAARAQSKHFLDPFDPRYPDSAARAGGQPVPSNASAAATLASGPKSAPVPVHNGADGPTNPRYNRVAVQNAINSSRQKIGGREAKMIHRLLSGGH